MIMSIDYREGYVYVSRGHVEGLSEYALTLQDHRPNYVLILKAGKEGYLGQLKAFYDAGAIKFETTKVKWCIDNYFKFVV